jgi:nitrite reductase/ring-hydroxylating ferredoxin subunit
MVFDVSGEPQLERLVTRLYAQRMSESAINLGDLSDLGDGQMRAFPELGTHGVVVCRVAGRLHALQDNCSHRDAQLSQGRLRGSVLVCPLHGAQFNVQDGQHKGPPASVPIACFPITEDGASALINLGGSSVEELSP